MAADPACARAHTPWGRGIVLEPMPERMRRLATPAALAAGWGAVHATVLTLVPLFLLRAPTAVWVGAILGVLSQPARCRKGA